MPDVPDETHVRIVPAMVHSRTLVRPAGRDAPRRWLVGFHGYAQSAEGFLEMLLQIPGVAAWRIASVQALHPFYSRSNDVVANWMTRQDREHAISDNVAYVDAVLNDLELAFGTPETLVFAGFSQGVAMAYRAAVLGRRRADAILAVGGDVPPELTSEWRHWPTVWIAAGARDNYYTPELLARDVGLLDAAGTDVRSLVFDGGHEWSAEVCKGAGALLTEIAARRG